MVGTKVTVECRVKSHVLVLCSRVNGMWRLFWHVEVAGVCFAVMFHQITLLGYVKNDMHW